MVKLANEPADTVEERQGLPSEEAQKRHMAHQAFHFPSSDTSTFQKASEPFANATEPFHGRESPQLFDVELKTEGTARTSAYGDLVKHHTVLLEIFPALVQRYMHLRGMNADDTNVVDK